MRNVMRWAIRSREENHTYYLLIYLFIAVRELGERMVASGREYPIPKLAPIAIERKRRRQQLVDAIAEQEAEERGLRELEEAAKARQIGAEREKEREKKQEDSHERE